MSLNTRGTDRNYELKWMDSGTYWDNDGMVRRARRQLMRKWARRVRVQEGPAPVYGRFRVRGYLEQTERHGYLSHEH